MSCQKQQETEHKNNIITPSALKNWDLQVNYPKCYYSFYLDSNFQFLIHIEKNNN